MARGRQLGDVVDIIDFPQCLIGELVRIGAMLPQGREAAVQAAQDGHAGDAQRRCQPDAGRPRRVTATASPGEFPDLT